MRPLLGDFLAASSRHLDAATGDLRLAAEASPSVVGELCRLTAVMAHCADAFTAADQSDSRHLTDARELAMADARSALRQAAARMRAAWGAHTDADDDSPPGTVMCLAAAAGNLLAGRDLLHTHFTTDQVGWRHGTSPWAPAIASGHVNAALVSEIGSYAGRLAAWALQLAAAGSAGRLPAQAQVAISEGCRWLWVAQAAARVVHHHPATATGHALLHAIPINLPPPRHPPHGGLPVPELCAGTTITAERLRHLAHLTAIRGHHPKAALAASWQRTAQAAAITGHCSELILRQLTQPGTHPPAAAAVATAIEQAAHAASRSWRSWRALAHNWDTFTTNRGTALTPVAAEIGDLVLWAGRLAHTDPAWTPARTHASQPRTNADFTGRGATITAVITALHHTSDALTRIAAHDRQNVRTSAATDQIYIPTRLLPEDDDVPYRYTPAPPAMLDELLATYDAATEAAMRATAALDQLVLTLSPQPTTLITLRATAPLTTPYLPHSTVALPARPIQQPLPGQVEQALRSRGISEPTLLARAADLDGAAKVLISSAAAITERRARATPTAGPAPKSSPPEHQHPARVAAKDAPPATTSSPSPPKLVPISHQITHNTATRRRPSR
jgi:hypothetical protein